MIPASAAAETNTDHRDAGIQRKHPEAVGLSAAGVLAYLDALEAQGADVHALLLHHQGYLAVEAYRWPFDSTRPRIWHSIAKAFTATAIGFALEEKRFKLTDKVVDFFPEHRPAVVGENLAAMTVRDLLSMRTGHAEETSGSRWRGIRTSWIAEFLKIPVVHHPGDVYIYTSAASYMLSAILTKTTGQSLHDYLRPRLFEPLGITGEKWDIGPDGINPGGNGFTGRITDLLKFGTLYLQKGKWNGRQIIPESWIEEATRPIGDSDYGLHWVTGPDGEFFAMGLFGQLIAVLPAYDAVIVIASAANRPDACSGALVPTMHQHLPSIFSGSSTDITAKAKLEDRITQWATPPTLASAPSISTEVRRYAIEENPTRISQLTFEFETHQCTITQLSRDGEHVITVGIDRWIEGETDIPGAPIHHGYNITPARVVAGGRWLSEVQFEMTWIFVEMTFRDTVVCDFKDGELTWRRSSNVNSGEVNMPVLNGHLLQG